MRLRRTSLAVAFLAVVGLSVAGIASSAGTQAVTTTTAGIPHTTICTTAVQTGNVTRQHCSGGQETWSGDISGLGIYSYDRMKNLATGTTHTVNGVETITNACVGTVCGGTLFSRWTEADLPSDTSASATTHIEQSFTGGTGNFTNAHGSIRLVGGAFVGQVGL